jgi:hypothetical protein
LLLLLPESHNHSFLLEGHLIDTLLLVQASLLLVFVLAGLLAKIQHCAGWLLVHFQSELFKCLFVLHVLRLELGRDEACAFLYFFADLALELPE